MLNALFLSRRHWFILFVILTIFSAVVFLFASTLFYKFKEKFIFKNWIFLFRVIPPLDPKNISLAQVSSTVDSSQWIDPVTAQYILLGACLWGLLFFSCVAVVEVPRCYAYYTGHKHPWFSYLPDGTLCTSAKSRFEKNSLEKVSSDIPKTNTTTSPSSSYSVCDETRNANKLNTELKIKTSDIEVSVENQNSTSEVNESLTQALSTDQGASVNVNINEVFDRLSSHSSNNSISSSYDIETVGSLDSPRPLSLQGFPSETNIADNIEAIYNSPVSNLFSEIPVDPSPGIGRIHLYERITEIWRTNFFAIPENFVGLAEFLNQIFQLF